MKRGKLAVITGPSAGVGKDTLLKLFIEKHHDWKQPPSTTTRQPREGEQAGKDMSFVSHETFDKWQKEDKFLETDFHTGNWYGTLKEPVDQLLSQGTNVLLRIDVNGALVVKKKIPDVILIFIAAESPEALENRIRQRGTEGEKQIKQRLKLAQKEMMLADKFDHVVINATNQQVKALKEIENTLTS